MFTLNYSGLYWHELKNLVRSDISRRSVDVDLEMIEKVISADKGLPRLYGVALLDDPSHINIQYPFTLTQVGELLSYPSWNGADKLINKNRKGVNIKSSDNKYHVTIQIGKTEMNKLITFPPSFTGCCVLLKIIYKHILPKGY